MHLSSHTWMRPEPLEETLKRLKHLGYSSVELAGEPGRYAVQETHKLLEKYGIACWGTVTIMQGDRDLLAQDPKKRRVTVQYMKDIVTLSAELGGQITTIVPSTVGKIIPTSTPDNECKWAVQGLREVAEFAKEKGIKIALEPLNRFETYFINRSDQALALAVRVLDKIRSIYQGRPARLREIDNRVPIEFLDEYEELDLFNTLTYSAKPCTLGQPTYSVSTFRELCKLSIIMDRILCKLYAEKSPSRDPVELFDTSRILQGELKHWRDSLPDHISIKLEKPELTAPLPHTLSLLSMYNSLVILLNRPFVSDGHLQSASASAASDAFSACAASAFEIHQILLMYRCHFCMTTTPYFVFYATYASATIHVRIAAQQRTDSEAHKRLQNCLYALADQQVNCHGPRQAMRILKGLIHRLKVHVKEVPEISPGNCQGAQVPSVSQEVDATAHIDPQSNPDASRYLSETYAIDSEPMFTDWDIDEVMRSFDHGLRYPLTPASTEGNTAQPQQASTSRMSAIYTENSMGDLVPTFEDAANYALQEPLFLDPLFGFDGPVY